MPPVQIPMNKASNFGFTAFRSIINEGKDKVVTAIIKDKIAPSCAPLANKASATGIVPKISAYIGIPTRVAKITENGLLLPSTVSIHDCGIQLWMNAPMPTPIKI